MVDRLEQRLAAVAGGLAELREQVPTRAEMNARFDEARRHVEVLLEDQRSETRLVAEAVAALGERMERGFTELRELFAAHRRSVEARIPKSSTAYGTRRTAKRLAAKNTNGRRAIAPAVERGNRERGPAKAGPRRVWTPSTSRPCRRPGRPSASRPSP